MNRAQSLQKLAATLLPGVFSGEYERILAEALPSLLCPQGPGSVLPPRHVPLRFRVCQAGAAQKPSADSGTMDIWDALYRSKRVALVGEPGSGKTATLGYVAIELAQHRLPVSYERRLTFLHQGKAQEHLLPIFADLARVDGGASELSVVLARALASMGLPGFDGFVAKHLHAGSCLLLLDGLDALDKSSYAHLDSLLSAYPYVLTVIAARTPKLAAALPGWTLVEPLPLDAEQSAALLSGALGDDSPAAAALLRAFERDAGLKALMDNPLLLSALASTAVKAGPERLTLPPLYEACVQVLWGSVPQRSRLPEPQDRDEQVLVLSKVALHLHQRHQDSFGQEQLLEACAAALGQQHGPERTQRLMSTVLSSGLVRQEDGDQFAFLRHSLREYLAASCLVKEARFWPVAHDYVGDPRWHEVIVLGAVMARDAEGTVDHILRSDLAPVEALLLGARCVAEDSHIGPPLRDQLREGLIGVLQGNEKSCWSEAALRLAALEGRRVQDYFPSMLRDGSCEERELAASVVGHMGTSDWALVPLLGALERRSPCSVRSRAAHALGELREKRAVRPLLEALGADPGEVGTAAADALADIGEPAVPGLIQALSSGESSVRRLVVRALGAMGDQALLPLLGIVQDKTQPDDVVAEAIEALGLLKDSRAIPVLAASLQERSGRLCATAARALAALGDAAVMPLVEAIPAQSADLGLRTAVVNALTEIGGPAIGPLIQCLCSPSTAVRAAAEQALGLLGPQAADALTVALTTSDWSLRRRIAQILATIGDQRLVEPLLVALRDPDAGVRAKAAQVLGQLGQEAPTVQLAATMERDPNEFVRRAAARALTELGGQRAIEPLIHALRDPTLRDIAVAALGVIGEPVVEPLLRVLDGTEDGEVHAAALQALQAVGARARVQDGTMSAVAKVYAQLFSDGPEINALLASLEHVRWYKPAAALHRSFSCARTIAQVRSLNEAADCRETLASVADVARWVRPTIGQVFDRLLKVSEEIGLYCRLPSRGGQRDAMLGATDLLNETQHVVDTALWSFERSALAPAVTRWRSLTEEAIKNLRGRAELRIEPLRADLPLDRASMSTMMVFRLTNVGDSAARNLSVTLKHSNGDGFEVVGEPTQRVGPLGTGMQRDVEFWIAPLGGAEANYAFEVSYDDDDGPGHYLPSSGGMRFLTVEEEYRPIPTSPYVMGPPVKTPEMFYGREDVLEWIKRNISGAYQENILVLHGERRMGKTSILYQLLNQPPTPCHVCVFFSLELDVPDSLQELLYGLADAIHEAMADQSLKVAPPAEEAFSANPRRALLRFLEEAVHSLGAQRLLIMIDEFDKLIHKVESGVLDEDVYAFIRGLWQHTERIAFIVTGAYKVRETLKDNESVLFHVAKPYRLSYLGQNDAKALIVKPVGGYLTYDNMVVDRILRVTACHPYFVQYICDSLVRLAQRLQKNWLYLPDLNVVLQEVIQDNAGVLQNAVYAPLNRAERLMLAGLANVTDDRTVLVPWESPSDVLREHGLQVPKKRLLGALRSLCERDLVIEQRVGRTLQYGFKMDLIRLWLRQKDMLLRLSQEERP